MKILQKQNLKTASQRTSPKRQKQTLIQQQPKDSYHKFENRNRDLIMKYKMCPENVYEYF